MMRCAATTILTTLLVIACASSDAPSSACMDGGALGLRLVDSTILAEPDTASIGDAVSTLTIDAASNIYIGDIASGRMLVYDQSGAFLQALGRRGGGPNEWSQVGAWGATWQDAVVFDDSGDRTLHFYRGTPKRFVGSLRYEGLITGLSTTGDSLRVALISRAVPRAGSVHAWPWLLEAAQMQTDTTLRGTDVPLPDIYRSMPELEAWLSAVTLSADKGTLTIFGATDYAVLADASGRSDTLPIPACGRRGFPVDVRDRWLSRRPTTRAEAQEVAQHTDSAFSAMIALWPFGPGRALWWNQDTWLERGGRILKGRAYVTLIDFSSRRACVDLSISAPGTERVRLGVHADTVITFDQLPSSDGSDAIRSVIHRYVVDDAACRWVPLRRATTTG